MRFFYAPSYDLGGGLPLRSVHGFVLDRPSRTWRLLTEQYGVAAKDAVLPTTLTLADFSLIHTEQMLEGVKDRRGIADAVEMPALKLLPSQIAYRAVTQPQLMAAGGTCAAIREAADGNWCVNLSGGFHHARPDLAHGFCLLNDVALGVSMLRKSGVSRRIAIVDLDAHQGDGNAAAFFDDPDVATLSVHEDALFPHPKLESTIDVGLPSGLGDDTYLQAVDVALDLLAKRCHPELVIYVAGVDPHVNDPLSSLRLSAEGMVRRDERVARFAKEHAAGLVMLPAGGYTTESPHLSAAGMHAVAQLAP
jgi:histone deacetylase 11